MTIYGYARVSTDSQTLQAQTEALHGAGCAKIYSEKISGACAGATSCQEYRQKPERWRQAGRIEQDFGASAQDDPQGRI